MLRLRKKAKESPEELTKNEKDWFEPDKEWFIPDDLGDEDWELPGVKNSEMGGFQWVIVQIEDVESDDGD